MTSIELLLRPNLYKCPLSMDYVFLCEDLGGLSQKLNMLTEGALQSQDSNDDVFLCNHGEMKGLCDSPRFGCYKSSVSNLVTSYTELLINV
jgi:hypothetical protein